MPNHVAVELPPSLAALPTDERGFTVPAEAPWEDGLPYIKEIDANRQLALAAARACTVCGLPMPVGQPIARVFTQAEAAYRRLNNRDKTIEDAGPGHASCMLYAAQVCPFLSTPSARLGKASLTAPGQRRGTRAAVLTYNDYQLALAASSEGPGAVRFVYTDINEDIPYRLPQDLTERYVATLANDNIDLRATRCYWRDTAPDRADLERRVKRAVKALPKPSFSFAAYGRDYYVFPVPLTR